MISCAKIEAATGKHKGQRATSKGDGSSAADRNSDGRGEAAGGPRGTAGGEAAGPTGGRTPESGAGVRVRPPGAGLALRVLQGPQLRDALDEQADALEHRPSMRRVLREFQAVRRASGVFSARLPLATRAGKRDDAHSFSPDGTP